MKDFWHSIFSWPVIIQGLIANALWQLIFWSVRSAYKNRSTIRSRVQTPLSHNLKLNLLGAIIVTDTMLGYNLLLQTSFVKAILYSLTKWMDHLPPASYVGILGVTLIMICCAGYFDKKEEEKKHREKQRRNYPVTWELEKLQATKRASLASGHKSIRRLHLL